MAKKEKIIDFSEGKNWLDIRGWLTKIKFNKQTEKAFVVEMFHRNGTKSFFLVFPTTNSFVRNKKRYIIDEEYKYYNNSTKNWALTYHEDISVPLDIGINTNKINKALNQSDSEIRSAINPESLEIYMKSSFVQKIMQGEEMDKIFKRLILLGMVGAIGTIIHLLLFVQMSGMLDKIGL